ncbi:metallophosphoesterase [Streptomyces sp. NBC_00503]|uniref:metallophosphoesterase n=1 Tax=Streptomyces sp. NBC_00503 TaxID=2903659 RepID=UPI002E81BFEE|nr:metallophosphoesterase [Streptomyces sp. NBC_00503]WUD86045.1 metallophosphoesterase [Streptomyces sp. NBC_00503]
MVEGSMTQGAGQGPAVRTDTQRDFRVPVVEPAPHSVPAGVTVPAGPPGDTPVYGEYPAYYGESPAPVPVPVPVPPPAPAPVPAQHGYGYEAPYATLPEENGPADEGDFEDYTPTQRDLPVIGRGALGGPGDTVQVQYVPQDFATDGPGPLYVVGDVHGYLAELVSELQVQGLIDADHNWAAGNARLWFLGDFTDRGPDGIGVIDLVMRLSAEAAAAGGYCKALMGNHELLLIGAKRFGDTPIVSGAGTATFQAAWLLNGGQRTDMERLQDVHLQWMSRLDAAVLVEDHLLLHSDTTAYLDYGDSVEDVNDTIHELLNRNDADITWDLFRKFTKRFAFRDEGTGPQAVRELLGTYGGSRVVHGHSPIPYLLGEVGTEDGDEPRGPEAVVGPHVYAEGLAIAMDGGVTMAGKLLVVELPLND